MDSHNEEHGPDATNGDVSAHQNVTPHSQARTDADPSVLATDVHTPGVDTNSTASMQVPNILREGVMMIKVTARKTKQTKVWITPEQGQMHWHSRKAGVLNLESIRELRFAEDSRHYRELFSLSASYEPCWITIIFTDVTKFKILHFIALSQSEFILWKSTLEDLFSMRKELMAGVNQMSKRTSIWLKQHWNMTVASSGSSTSPTSPTTASPLSPSTSPTSQAKEVVSQPDDLVNFEDVRRLCAKLCISCSSSDLKNMFNQADTHHRQCLDFSEFQIFVKLLKRRKDIEELLISISNGADTLSYADFRNFLRDVQESPLTDAEIMSIFTKFTKTTQENPQESRMTAENLTAFLMSSDNLALDDKQTKLYQDMSRPLNEYYINSSHNTYLTGGQLRGESSVEGYVRALQQGARCVELDIWDGSNGDPVVFHGRTLTSKLPARDALRAIAKYAFVVTSYPVILSFEIHCDTSQQGRLAKLLREILGEALLTEPLPFQKGHVKDGTMSLPSPEDLRWRILIKAKDMFLYKEQEQKRKSTSDSEISATSSEASSNSDSDIRKTFTSAFRRLRSGSSSSGSTSGTVAGGGDGTDKSDISPPERVGSNGTESSGASFASSSTLSRKSSSLPMSLDLLAMLVYIVGVKCRGFNQKENYAPTHCVSLSEKRFAKVVKQSEADLISHNRTHLVRTYPDQFRVSSSNFLPHDHWVLGSQLVAINWQTHDLGAEINAAMFLRNGRTGYILKPDPLRMKFDKDKGFLSRSTDFVFEVEVISGHQLSRPRVNGPGDGGLSPFVQVEILPPRVEVSKAPRQRTQAVQGNAFNPIFRKTMRLPFTVIGGMLELVFVRFSIRDENNDDINLGRFCANLAALNPGYRHLHLCDEAGQQFLFSSLFVRTKVTRIEK